MLAISAIVIAIQMITKYCKKLKYKRTIVLVTDARGSIDADDSSEITKKILEDGMQLVVVWVYHDPIYKSCLNLGRGVDFDDAEYGFKEEEKDPTKVHLMTLLSRHVTDVGGN